MIRFMSLLNWAENNRLISNDTMGPFKNGKSPIKKYAGTKAKLTRKWEIMPVEFE
jgi:hypothetical protein